MQNNTLRVVLPEVGSNLLPKRSVLFWVSCENGKHSCQCCW